jgi:hypothetical protein
LFALAGATSSLVYGTAQGAQGQVSTAATATAFESLPAIAGLSTRIATAAAARAQAMGRTLLLTGQACDAVVADLALRSDFELDIVLLKLEFTPGYQFRMTVVARVTERACEDAATLRTQRLAYRGPIVSMSKDSARAALAFNRELETAVVALGPEVDLYLQGKRGRIIP